MQRILLFLALLFVAPVHAQQNPPNPDAPGELDKLKNSCGSFAFNSLGGCAEELFTGQPVHIAVGSIAPQNGFGAGFALVGHKDFTTFRTTWNADAVATGNQSWRAGVYIKLMHTPIINIVPVSGESGPPPKANLTQPREYSVFNIYAQAISLNKLMYFGLGPSTLRTARSYFGMKEEIIGASVIKPIFAPLKMSLYGEVNGRFVDIRGAQGQPSPSIEQLYTEATAPGLTSQPGFVQFGEGIRMRPTPAFLHDYVRFNYSVLFQQFVAPGDSRFSFRRVTADLSHQFPLYRKTTRYLVAQDFNGPDECSIDKDVPACPKVLPPKAPDKCRTDKNAPGCPQITRDLEGSFGIRLFISESIAPSGNVVPFYFDPTLGGSDIDGNAALTSFQDYRFRAPNVMLLRESFEHSIYPKWPLGIALAVDEGKVALTRGKIDFTHLAHSYSAGLTLRAGGYPQIYLMFSWGGNEGTHTSAAVNTALLGGSARPSLF